MQELRHTYSSLKGNCLRWIKIHGSAVDTGRLKLQNSLDSKVEAWLGRNVPSYARSKGMFYYCQQPDIAPKVTQLIEQKRKELEKSALEKGSQPAPFSPWSEGSKARAKLWSELPRTEQRVWTQRSKDSPMEEDKCVIKSPVTKSLTLSFRDIQIEAALSALGTLNTAVAEARGLYMVVWTAIPMGDETYTVA